MPPVFKLANAAPPAPPRSLSDLDIPPAMVVDIALRFLREHSASSLTELRKNLKLSHPVVEEIFHDLRDQKLIEIRRSLAGGDYLFGLTTEGHRLAATKSQTCRYAGPAPVSLRQYTHVVQAQKRSLRTTPQRLRDVLGDLVVADRTIDQLGTALFSHRPLFIYGPAGNGKTSILERLFRVYADSVLLPHAVEADGQIITVFDQVKHEQVDCEISEKLDQRWICCRRPCLMAAGELTAASLNVNWEEHAGVYSAPLQMKANCGTLCIDDFGRQPIPPRELLNRWILPLDRGLDYLSLRHGFTFPVPFELMLIFATNLEPLELADEAFLRRVPSKLFVASPTQDIFDEVFRRVLRRMDLTAEPELMAYFRSLCSERSRNGLQACYPRDIMEILVSSAAYQGQPAEVTPDALEAAAEMYFAHSCVTVP